MKPCYYCQRNVETEDSIDFCYMIEEDESITHAHLECAEISEGRPIREPIEWIGYDPGL